MIGWPCQPREARRSNCSPPISCAAVWIGDGAQGNQVGPDNLIAFNGKGLWVTGQGTVGNTITANRIHDNGLAGITLWGGGNRDLAAPEVRVPAGGRVRGRACAGCQVELFGDDAGQGARYLGRTRADATGLWQLDLPPQPSHEHLTATTTDAAGNTSAFSAPAPWRDAPGPIYLPLELQRSALGGGGR